MIGNFQGRPANELWGVSSGPKPERSRGPAARARRAAKRKAKRMGVTLRWYLRNHSKVAA